MTDSPDDATTAVLAALLGDGSPGESLGDATDVAGNGAEGTTQFKASTAASATSAAGEQHLLA